MDELLKNFDTYRAIVLFVLFALPGFISLQVWSLLVPVADRDLKDTIPEALAFGVVNAAVGAPLFLLFENPLLIYLLAVFVLVAAPVLWPFCIKEILKRLERKKLILDRARSGWDSAFLRREPYFVIVHLNDGRRLGGYYGYKSYAGLHPCSGHLYLETLWTLDKDGHFLAPIPDSQGAVLRPGDYHFVELLASPEESTDGERLGPS